MYRTLLGPKTLTTAALAASFSGCAGPQLDAQWRNVELPVNYLRGATVLVSCEASDIVVKLNTEINRILSSPGVREKYNQMAFETMASPPNLLTTMAMLETPKWAEIIKRSGAKVE